MRRPLEQSGETVGARLRRLRLARGLTQRDLAGPGVSYAYISRIEAGARQPSVKTLRRLAAKLGVDVVYLETGIELEAGEARELRLAGVELELRLDDPGNGTEELGDLLAEAEEAGDLATALRARSQLALAALRRGEPLDAIGALEHTVTSDGLPTPADPEPVLQLARAYLAAGRSGQAVDLLERALAETAEAGDAYAAAALRYATLLGRALASAGDLGRARALLEQALAAGAGAHDPLSLARLARDQARQAEEQGEQRAALRASRLALALLDAAEAQRQLGRAHLLAAELHDAGGAPEQAAEHLAAAERLLDELATDDDQSWLGIERARQLLPTDPGRAAAIAQSTLDLGGSDDAERGAAWLVLAHAREQTGASEDALTAFHRAAELLERARIWPEAVAARRAWAQLLRGLGRVEEAATVLDEGLALAAVTGQAGVPLRF